MVSANQLPQFETCIGLYLAAYDRYETDSFTAEQIDRELSISDTQRVLELAVAYGLLAFDGSSYRVTCEPDASTDTWHSTVRDRASLIRETIADRDGDEDVTNSRSDDVLIHKTNEFKSVFVSKSDEFDSIVERIESLSLADCDGVVLRSPGTDANRVQRFADRLCDDSEPPEPSLSTSLQKVYSDVVGDDKNQLEFQLYLQRQ